MGTRGIYGYRIGDKLYAGYNHYDSYCSCLGKEIVEFIQKVTAEDGWEKFKQNGSKVELVDDSTKVSDQLVERYKEYSDTKVSSGSPKEWYCLLRKLQGVPMLEEIYKGKVEHMPECNPDSMGGLKYGYVLNLNTMVLECYRNEFDFIGSLPFQNIKYEKMQNLYGEE